MDVAVAGYMEVGLFGRGQIGGTYLGAAGFPEPPGALS